jgi:fatty acid-binding protein DegV
VTAIVTDSTSQLPPSLRTRYDVRIVPVTIVVDGIPLREGVDISAEEFYERLAAGAVTSTAAPAPGEVLSEYQAAAELGATQILSIHAGANSSDTIEAAYKAAPMSPIPVEIVDTGTISFPVACCVWSAGEVLADGGDLAAAAAAAKRTATTVGYVFVVGARGLGSESVRRDRRAAGRGGTAIMASEHGDLLQVGTVYDVDATLEVMTNYVDRHAAGAPQRVGVGDAGSTDLAEAFAVRLRALPCVAELVHYRIGPSVGARTGPDTVSACFFPL